MHFDVSQTPRSAGEFNAKTYAPRFTSTKWMNFAVLNNFLPLPVLGCLEVRRNGGLLFSLERRVLAVSVHVPAPDGT